MDAIVERQETESPLVPTLNCDAVSDPAKKTGMEDTVSQYFIQFNQGNYDAVANLFAVDGALVPPFEAPVGGREAIASYLAQEADGMVVDNPTIVALGEDEGDGNYVKVRGHVTALVFKVGVAWQFSLNPQHEIERVEVELLASLEELIGLRSR